MYKEYKFHAQGIVNWNQYCSHCDILNFSPSKSATIRFLNSIEYLRVLRILRTFAFIVFHALSGQPISGTYNVQQPTTDNQ